MRNEEDPDAANIRAFKCVPKDKDFSTMTVQKLQADFTTQAQVFDLFAELDEIQPPVEETPAPAPASASAKVIPFPLQAKPAPRSGQPDAEVEAIIAAFMLDYGHTREKAEGTYALRLYKGRPNSGEDAAAWGAWYDQLTDHQRDILGNRARANGRAQYAAKKLAETGKAVRSYVRGKTEEQKRADAAARKRKSRAKNGGTVKLTPEQRAEIAREKARLRKQKSRAAKLQQKNGE